jgi:hypothetical protein
LMVEGTYKSVSASEMFPAAIATFAAIRWPG